MPQEPKKRHSRARQGKRRASIHFKTTGVAYCANCGATMQAHTACKQCGFYKGISVMKAKTRSASSGQAEAAQK